MQNADSVNYVRCAVQIAICTVKSVDQVKLKGRRLIKRIVAIAKTVRAVKFTEENEKFNLQRNLQVKELTSKFTNKSSFDDN